MHTDPRRANQAKRAAEKRIRDAAPDMLAALRAVRESFIVAGGMPLSDEDALTVINAAIAKAEGK